jgi:hypothetical protein
MDAAPASTFFKIGGNVVREVQVASVVVAKRVESSYPASLPGSSQARQRKL